MTCYLPNGTATTDPNQVSCKKPGQTHSMCCALSNVDNADYCTSGADWFPPGLCIGGGGGGIWRDTCTDPNWGPDCLSLCIEGQEVDDNSGKKYDLHDEGAWNVTPCGDGTFCCGDDAKATTCCANHLGVYVVNNTNTTQKPAGFTSYGTSTTITAIPTANPSSASPKTNVGAIVGGTIGGFVAGVLIALLLFSFYHRRAVRRHKSKNPEITRYEKVAMTSEPGDPHALAEAPGDGTAVELGGSAPKKSRSRLA